MSNDHQPPAPGSYAAEQQAWEAKHGPRRAWNRADRNAQQLPPVTPFTSLQEDISDLKSRLDSVREQRDAAQRERNRLLDEVAALRIQVQFERDRNKANENHIRNLSGECNHLGKRLIALTASVAGAADEYGLREEAGE